MPPVSSQDRDLSLLKAAKRAALDAGSAPVLALIDTAPDFGAWTDLLKRTRLIIASDRPVVQKAARDAELPVVALQHEPQTRQTQLSQALLEAIADDLLASGDTVVCLYSLFEKHGVDSLSVVSLADHLSRLTSRDLRRLDTQVPLETLRQVVDLAVEIGHEGREGKKVGALFAVGDHERVMALSHEQVHDPFRGYSRKDRMIRNPRVQESIKEIAQMDGAFVVGCDGLMHGAGRNLNAPAEGLTLSKGLGSRHWAAAAMSKVTDAILVAVSESTGTVRVFQNGRVVLRIEPVDRGLRWSELHTEPPSE
ncbi:DNA integrity scanning protein DisA nucleotide-binding domain protein [Alienimonas sp. DA493]|uniref:DNA integrity scanning protein DisA nucleotide-binding domain protein n=1 Tax=Alienimonas sp. DA493 TaxID=3373605 RepID=UPI0037546B2E